MTLSESIFSRCTTHTYIYIYISCISLFIILNIKSYIVDERQTLLLNYFPNIKSSAYPCEIPSFRMQFVLLLIAKVHSSKMKFLVLGGSVVSAWPAWMPVRHSLSRGSVQQSERPPIGIPQLGALANSNLSADTLAKCGMSWQSCRMFVLSVLTLPRRKFQGTFLLKTLRHTITQERSRSCMT